MLPQIKYLLGFAVLAAVVAPQAPQLLQDFKRAPAQPVVAARPAIAPAAPATTGIRGEVSLPPEQGGHYFANVEIEGVRLRMMVDTGATVVALSQNDAERLGLRPAPSDFTVPVSTANGVAKAARVKLREARIDTISLRDVEALVLPSAVASQSLLGMSFLKRLSSFSYDSQRLVLRQ